MRKAFRVATVFTGAAACAAVFTPGATAIAAPTAKTAQIEPDAFHIDCTGGATTSVHFYYSAEADHGPICVGEKGYTSLNSTAFSEFCAGNNYGWFLVNGHKASYSTLGLFAPSYGPLYGGKVGLVDNEGWGGDNKCGF